MKRLTWENFVDKAFWALLIAVTSFGVKGVSDLNIKMSVVIDQLSNQSKALDAHEARILYLERHITSIRAKNGP